MIVIVIVIVVTCGLCGQSSTLSCNDDREKERCVLFLRRFFRLMVLFFEEKLDWEIFAWLFDSVRQIECH